MADFYVLLFKRTQTPFLLMNINEIGYADAFFSIFSVQI